MGLGVASPNYLGAYSPTGVRFNSGGGLTVTYYPVGSTTTTGLHGHYGNENFGILGSFYSIDPEDTTADTTDFSVAGGTTNFTLGVNDDSDYGFLFSFSDNFRIGLTGNSDSDISTIGMAYDMSAVTIDLDYGVDSSISDYSKMSLGLGFNGGIFFAGFVHTIVKLGTVSADATIATLGFGEQSWIFSVEYKPVENSDDLTMAKFTMNF